MPDKLKAFDIRLGKAIKSARSGRNWSQQRLAAKINVQRATLSNYERGDRPIPTRTLNKIALALEVTPSYFFPEAEAAANEALGQAATRQLKIEQIENQLADASSPTLDMILTVMNLGGSR